MRWWWKEDFKGSCFETQSSPPGDFRGTLGFFSELLRVGGLPGVVAQGYWIFRTYRTPLLAFDLPCFLWIWKWSKPRTQARPDVDQDPKNELVGQSNFDFFRRTGYLKKNLNSTPLHISIAVTVAQFFRIGHTNHTADDLPSVVNLQSSRQIHPVEWKKKKIHFRTQIKSQLFHTLRVCLKK